MNFRWIKTLITPCICPEYLWQVWCNLLKNTKILLLFFCHALEVIPSILYNPGSFFAALYVRGHRLGVSIGVIYFPYT